MCRLSNLMPPKTRNLSLSLSSSVCSQTIEDDDPRLAALKVPRGYCSSFAHFSASRMVEGIDWPLPAPKMYLFWDCPERKIWRVRRFSFPTCTSFVRARCNFNPKATRQLTFSPKLTLYGSQGVTYFFVSHDDNLSFRSHVSRVWKPSPAAIFL